MESKDSSRLPLLAHLLLVPCEYSCQNFAMTDPQATQSRNVNAPLGEAYSAYWDKWLSIGAATARKQFAIKSYDTSPIGIFDQLYEQYGGNAVFHLVRQQGTMDGLDVPSLMFATSSNHNILVQRWQKIAQAQTEIRFGASSSKPDFVQQLASGELILSPSRIKPANLSRFGTAMLAGVMVHALEQTSAEKIEIFEAQRAGCTRSINDGQEVGTLDFDLTSDLIFRAGSLEAGRDLKVWDAPCLRLNHLLIIKTPVIPTAGAVS